MDKRLSSLPGFWMANRWQACAESPGFRARPATRSSPATTRPGLTDRSRRPYRHANQLPDQIETLIVRTKRDKPHWGAPKIRERLARLHADIHTPAISTVHAVLDRHGLVKRRTRRRNRAEGTALSWPAQPNELWCADCKGEFMLADRQYCYPLTITDFASRYLIASEALSTTKEAYASSVFESVFKEFALSRAIRADNGVPTNSLFNLSKLSGLVAPARHRDRAASDLEAGGHQAGRSKLPAAADQVRRLHRLYSNEQPDQALNMQCAAQLYRPSARPYRGLPDLNYPFHDKAATVTTRGRTCFNRQKISLSQVFAGQTVVRRPDRRHQANRRPHLARQLYGL